MTMPLIEYLGRGRLLVAGIAAAALIAAACSGGDDAASSPSDSTPAASGAAADTTTDTDADTNADVGASDAATGDFQGEGRVTGAGQFDWQVSRVDQGTKPDIDLDADGSALIAYMLERQGSAGFVRVATATGDGSDVSFDVATLQTGYFYGPLDLEVSDAGVAAVAYHNHDWEDGAVAIRNDDGDWDVTRIADAGHDGWDNALAFAADGSLHTVGIDPSQFGAAESIEYAALSGGQWQVQPLGSGPQPYEWGTDIAIDAGGGLHVVYFDASSQDLIYATNDGSGWQLDTIYESGDAGRFAVLAIDATGVPHVAFFQTDASVSDEGPAPGNIVYGTLDGSDWSFETIGAVDNQVLGFEGARRTIALDLYAGAPLVAFIDESGLSLATRSDGVWTVESVLTAADDPFQVVGLAVGNDGDPHLTFSTITGNQPLDGEVWYVAPLRKT